MGRLPCQREPFIKCLRVTSTNTALAFTDELAYFTGLAEDKHPEQREANYLLLGYFVSNSHPNRTKYQNEFYEYLRGVEQRKQSQKLIQTKGLQESLEDLEYQHVPLGRYQRRISKLFKEMQSVEEDATINPSVKKTYIDDLQKEVNALYKEAVEELRAAKAAK